MPQRDPKTQDSLINIRSMIKETIHRAAEHDAGHLPKLEKQPGKDGCRILTKVDLGYKDFEYVACSSS